MSAKSFVPQRPAKKFYRGVHCSQAFGNISSHEFVAVTGSRPTQLVLPQEEFLNSWLGIQRALVNAQKQEEEKEKGGAEDD